MVPSRAAPSDDTMDVDVGEGAQEHNAGQGGARQDYDDWDTSESDDGFCIQTDRSQGQRMNILWTLIKMRERGLIVITLKKK